MKYLDFGPLTSNAAKLFKDTIKEAEDEIAELTEEVASLEEDLSKCQIFVIGNYSVAPVLSDGTVLEQAGMITLRGYQTVYRGTCDNDAEITITTDDTNASYYFTDTDLEGTIEVETEETISLDGARFFICENDGTTLPPE